MPPLGSDHIERRLAADARLNPARDGLVLEFHPRHCLRTGRLLAVEAIPRWPHRLSPSFALAAPTSSMAERHPGRVLGVTLLQMACSEAASWRGGGARLSLRLPAPLPSSEEICLQVSAVLAETGLPPERLELALPETFSLSLDEDAALAFAVLRDNGVNLLLDEFGHAVASLIALRDMPLTGMKMDRLMLRSLPADEANLAIIQAAVRTAHVMGLSVCADGVDREDLKQALRLMEIDEGQGLAFSPPLTAEEVRDYVAAWTSPAAV
ncbi:EAL domain-containing protein [Acidisoma sp. C75]